MTFWKTARCKDVSTRFSDHLTCHRANKKPGCSSARFFYARLLQWNVQALRKFLPGSGFLPIWRLLQAGAARLWTIISSFKAL